MVDVSFGGDGATKPLPLNENQITRNIGTQDLRLARDFLPGQTELSEERKLWIYQYRNSPTAAWNSFFAFSDLVEFLPADFHVMNSFTGSDPESFQTFTVLVVKFLRRPKEDGSGEDEVFGKRTLVDGLVKENLSGKTIVARQCADEEERITALSELFEIELTEQERESIKGWRTELKESKSVV